MQTLEETAYDLALRALSEQERELAELRTRTATLLTIASLTASFLAPPAIAASGFGVWVVLALLAFGVTVSLSIYLLLPKGRLVFALDARDVYEAMYGIRDDPERVHRRLVYWLHSYRSGNEPTVVRLTRAFRLASAAVSLEMALLLWSLVVP